MSDPTFSDIDFENKIAWVWANLKNQARYSGLRFTGLDNRFKNFGIVVT